MEVELLRPGTTIPHPTTVSTDIKFLYLKVSKTVREYFKKRNRSIHLAIDGWTAPIVASYLGIVVIWYDMGKIHRAVLEFICLIAKIFISFFFKQYKCKKTVTVAAGTKRKRYQGRTATALVAEQDERTVLEEDDILSPEDDELAQVLEEEDSQLEDDGQAIHDQRIVKTLRERAINEMARKGVVISDRDAKEALGIFLKVAGLAKRVHDSPGTLGEKFKIAIQLDDQLTGEKTTLDHRVPTRWNSDFYCLEAHIYFKVAVQALTSTAVNNLKAFRLMENQWALAERLVTVLPIFDGPTKVFSHADLSLIPDVVPMLEDLEAVTRQRNTSG
ncbi:hypothetical protein SCP_0804360 [Sparassis crispa]|uniref:Uncharacterized protein n=1 Tax=Sparassis crispa TaxID=139825 RepID=A0A401GUM5_9APHY|nr:hypothetical protein SCP_0804360 [Sparassis crispa]GBE85912.1 hypothetical protein SCP_0804360 [Sparassis crispa]